MIRTLLPVGVLVLFCLAMLPGCTPPTSTTCTTGTCTHCEEGKSPTPTGATGETTTEPAGATQTPPAEPAPPVEPKIGGSRTQPPLSPNGDYFVIKPLISAGVANKARADDYYVIRGPDASAASGDAAVVSIAATPHKAAATTAYYGSTPTPVHYASTTAPNPLRSPVSLRPTVAGVSRPWTTLPSRLPSSTTAPGALRPMQVLRPAIAGGGAGGRVRATLSP